jgi:hypothetical protein
MSLDEKARLFLVGFAQTLACFDGLGKPSLKILGLRDTNAIGALPTKMGQVIRDDRSQAIHGFGKHQSQSVFTGARRASQDHSLGKPATRQHVAHLVHSFRIAVKVRKRHKSRHQHSARSE